MILIIAIAALCFTVYFFIKDAGGSQVISSRFNSFYRPFTAETVVQHEYVSKPDTIWKALTSMEDYCLWFPGVGHLLPVVDEARYVHRFSFDRFSFEPGAYFKVRPKTFFPWFKGRIMGIETNKRLEMKMRFNPVSTETVSFEINLTPTGSSEVICRRTSQGLFSFLTTWGFADSGSSILHNLSDVLPDDWTKESEEDSASAQTAGPQLSRETIIAQAVQAGLDGNLDLINAIPDKPTRGMAKAALVKAKRVGSMPDHLVKALDAGPVAPSGETAAPQPVGSLPSFQNNDDLVAYVVNKALDGDMDPINSIPEKPLRGKAKAAMVKAKRTGERPAMPDVPDAPQSTPDPTATDESEEDLVLRLVDAGVAGNMDEINGLENKVLRGKIKAAIVKAKRANN